MKPDEIKALWNWTKKHFLVVYGYLCWSVLAGTVALIAIPSRDLDAYWPLTFAPSALPPAALVVNWPIYRLRTIGERKQKRAIEQEARIRKMERELLG